MAHDGGGQLELYRLAPPVGSADITCICGHYGIEHALDKLGQPCQAHDLFGQPCDCPGFEPDRDEP